VGFSATIWKISSRTSLLIRFLPSRALWRDSQVQYKRKPARCQRTTVSGVTTTRAFLHPVQNRRAKTQNSLSGAERPGLGLRALKTTSC